MMFLDGVFEGTVFNFQKSSHCKVFSKNCVCSSSGVTSAEAVLKHQLLESLLNPLSLEEFVLKGVRSASESCLFIISAEGEDDV